MSEIIDSKVVEMSFDNSQFETGVKQTMGTLEGLKKQLAMTDTTKQLANFSNSLSSVTVQLNAMNVAAMTVVSRLTNSLLDTVSGAIRSVTGAVDQALNTINNGGLSRAMNIEEAKFKLEGLGIAWADVYKYMLKAKKRAVQSFTVMSYSLVMSIR